MENISEIEQQLRAAERASAAAYIEYPPTRWWYAPAVGAWAAALLATLVLLDDEQAFRLGCLAGLLAIQVTALSRYRTARGTMPNLQNAPAEIARQIRRYCAGVLIVVAVITAAAATLPAAGTIAITFALVTAGTAKYEQVYERAAAATRARLG